MYFKNYCDYYLFIFVFIFNAASNRDFVQLYIKDSVSHISIEMCKLHNMIHQNQKSYVSSMK